MPSLRDTLRSDRFAVTAELALTPQQSIQEIVTSASQLSACTDAIQISDHRNARPHISPVAVAAHLLPHAIEPVVHINCRDRNRISIQSELLSAQSFGISNLLLARGSDLPAAHRPPATGVYDVSAIDLVRTAAAIRDGEAMAGAAADAKAEFFIGTVATAFSPKRDWQPEKLTAKADAGAQFVQLQLCMSTDVIRDYVSRLVDARLTWRFQLLANIAVPTSVDDARAIRSNNPGAIIPSELVARLESADDARAEGIAIAAELVQELHDIAGISGVNLQTAADTEQIVAAIERSGVRPNEPT